MAKYDWKYACGHWGETQLFGKHVDRDAWLNRARERLCNICQGKAALADPRSADLPSLTGTGKQIAWAAQIRLRAVCKIADYWAPLAAHIDAARTAGTLTPLQAGWADLIEQRIAQIRSTTEAQWWINHRDDSTTGLIRTPEIVAAAASLRLLQASVVEQR